MTPQEACTQFTINAMFVPEWQRDMWTFAGLKHMPRERMGASVQDVILNLARAMRDDSPEALAARDAFVMDAWKLHGLI